MDIRQLHYFLVLCEEMNYTRAAQRLFLSRQALRQSISALEAELCGPLFLSAHHKLTLTDRGMSLQRHATPVVEQFQHPTRYATRFPTPFWTISWPAIPPPMWPVRPSPPPA